MAIIYCKITGNWECCGSVIHVPLERRELTGPFNRIIPGGILTVDAQNNNLINALNSNSSSLVENSNQDLLPPGRVTDLKIQIDKANQRVTFYWTAVGDDFDIGAGSLASIISFS